jgi:lysophospholipase L1-like esterase
MIRRCRLLVVGLVFGALASLAPATAGAGSGALLGTGDSIAFGTNIGLDPAVATNFVGYPTDVAAAEGQALTNSACPGETSSHFVSLGGADLVCGVYRAQFPLHASYSTSQLDFTTSFLRAHPETQLVTIDIGANDLFRLGLVCTTGRTTFTFQDIVTVALSQNTTPSARVQACVLNGLTATLAHLGENLDTIYATWRAAGYRGAIVALTVYSNNYANVAATTLIADLDGVIARHTAAFGGIVADCFGAFRQASTGSGGDACRAGLLNPLPPQLGVAGCDVHPSPAGRAVLAGAVPRALRS